MRDIKKEGKIIAKVKYWIISKNGKKTRKSFLKKSNPKFVQYVNNNMNNNKMNEEINKEEFDDNISLVNISKINEEIINKQNNENIEKLFF